MDIVDTFNHLIPTEHLDDALFLGSNLESEGCDDFATSQNVIEDSLKNMLSDKDPMLGSASTQFCLPVLDSTDPNFQISSSTGVGLDDIMDVAVVKDAVSDPNDEDDLIPSNKNVNRLQDPSLNLRKSSRLMEQEPARSLRQSTVEKHLNSVQTSPKKSRSSRKDISVEQVKDKDDILLPEEKRRRRTSQLEQLSTSPTNSRRSPRIANRELKDKMSKEEKIAQKSVAGESSDGIGIDILPNTPCVLQAKVDQSETLQGDPVTLSNENSIEVLGAVTEHNLSNSQENRTTDLVQKSPTEEKVFDQDMYTSAEKKSDVIYDKVHKELALLSGVVECNLSVNTLVQSTIKSECSLGNIDACTNPNESKNEAMLKSSDLASTGIGQMSSANSIVLESDVNRLQETQASELKDHVVEQESLQIHDGSSKQNRNRKSSKRLKSNPLKTQQSSTSCTNKKTVAARYGTLKKKKTSAFNLVESEVQAIMHAKPQGKQRIIKVRKQIADSTKDDSLMSGNKIIKKKTHSGEKRTPHLQTLTQTPLKKQILDDTSKDNQGSSKETCSRRRSSSHSSEKSVTKHQSPVYNKVSNEGKDIGDHKAKDIIEHKEAMDFVDDKIKLKKSLPPRQRRSSKSISVDEPPLFIPDNIPNVKRDLAELPSPSEKHAWNPIRHCSSCRKLHGNRFMVGCGRCDDWFHGECVGLSLPQAQQMEAEDREYICMKCCAEEEKMEVDASIDVTVSHQKIDVHQDIQVEESEKSITKSLPSDNSSQRHEKPKHADDTTKHKVKISKKDSGDGKHSLDRRDSQVKTKSMALDHKHLPSATSSQRASEEKREKPSKDLNVQCPEERTSKFGIHEKQEIKKKKQEKKGLSSQSSHSSTPSTPKPSVDQIRQSVRQSLKDIFVKRLSESSSKIPEERATKVSVKIEKELFSFYRDTDAKYKNKYRSLMFNLKDPKNNVLFKRVLKGEITPDHLIKMSPEELASRELAAWRQRENRHTIEMIEKEQREVERRPITKITHKGEIEIESDAPLKEPESMDTEETIVKPVEKEEEIQKEKDVTPESTSDTTGQHKNHLFDLNCKICTGRMAPPAEDLSPKKVKVSMEMKRKLSDEADNSIEAVSSTTNALNLDVLETEKQELPKESFSSATSSEPFHIADIIEDESTFLSRLNYIWKGFLNMPSVAKFVIKAYPVSGSLEHLTEDLPDSIQVGGRISPQTVWDYVDKIKASGTKETCLIRFSPVTEEDQISYTLLYSYFSSRKRYGVVANNMRQVKDMYLIPLGASEKIPHFFVPFDGPGLEVHRPNLLLALIIRQKVKRQHSLNLDDEPPGALINVPSEKKSRIEIAEEDDEEDDENDFFNSFTAVLHKNRNRAPLSDSDEPQTTIEPVPEIAQRDPPKPLRFLPGVLVGWENPQTTLDLANKPLPVDDILQSLLGTTENIFVHKQSVKNVFSPNSLMDDTINMEGNISSAEVDTFVESKTPENNEENTATPASVTPSPSGALRLSLKGKPPDVSTEAFLENLNVPSSEERIDNVVFDDHADESGRAADTCVSLLHVNKASIKDDKTTTENISNSPKSPKLLHIKRDPRQAAVKTHKTGSDIKEHESNNKEEKTHKEKDSLEKQSQHKKDKIKKLSYEENDLLACKNEKSKGEPQFLSPTQLENTEKSKPNDVKPFTQDLLIDETDPLQQFRRALAANKSQSSNAPASETHSKNPASAFGGNFSAIRLQQPPFLPLKTNPPAFPFQHTPSFPLQGSTVFPYTTQIPPLLPTPLGIGFPRPPRFPTAETSIHNPLVTWHPALQLSRQPPHYLGQITPGPLLGPEQMRYQGPQKFYHRDHRGPERRHSDPWDKADRILDRSLTRGSREHRQRFYSESHHSREKRQHEKESDKHGDKDCERSRRRERDKDRSHDRDRKSRDESHRDKERSRSSHSDKSSESKSHKEGRNLDKSKTEDRVHDKEKNRNRDREEDRERDRHHRDKDHSDKSKSKR
ncbi:PHD finger 3 isoform X1 [Pelobates cultripes]|uniref:PHD finger 3 isoform X1 n=1 Tax=Pelobates cultripes TaxID=61616 RepID=A0AAD1RCT7_PELCU|nr:PHD finger 3 isoform X1 [Pelobates cultripes]